MFVCDIMILGNVLTRLNIYSVLVFNEKIKTLFYEKFEWYLKKTDNSIRKPWYQERITKSIQEILKARRVDHKRTSLQYHLISKFDLLEDGDDIRLIERRKTSGDPIVLVTPVEHYYDVLLETHMSTGHGGRDKMLNAIKHKFKIPRSAIEIFISLCDICSSKRTKQRLWF